MRTAEINTTIVDGYVGLLDNLSTNDKLDLISKLTTSTYQRNKVRGLDKGGLTR